MNKLLFGGAALLGSAAAVAQVAPAPQAKAAKVHTLADVQAKVTEHFAKLDTNRDGSVTKAEADSARAALRGEFAERRKERREQRREQRRETAFERIDANRDNVISRAEWDAHAAQREQRIASRDRNGDSRPDRRRMHRGGDGMAALGGHMFDMADSNRDGRVTLQEAQTVALRHFDMADANRDGQVTPDERRQARKRMRAQHRS